MENNLAYEQLSALRRATRLLADSVAWVDPEVIGADKDLATIDVLYGQDAFILSVRGNDSATDKPRTLKTVVIPSKEVQYVIDNIKSKDMDRFERWYSALILEQRQKRQSEQIAQAIQTLNSSKFDTTIVTLLRSLTPQRVAPMALKYLKEQSK
ncbi:hypothetical protein Acj9p125 [Acinetobacter phage Acj9]|uniref:Uncharacterized protein n=1 Tax=Acinetobacter phage Acj9 TaxID=760939 RepID=E5EPQ9_9CAUD|nr:hypothetical protein Acj9p125 [Acinetobacter phage Acj9]ADG60025.1 hypothetical protein Acj9p125 [Acinetobacter phage Acj9]